MKLLKRFSFSVPLLFLILLGCIHEGTSTLLLSSLLAMSGGLMMGKMTLGGLMMMLMAANQQQNGQNLFKNLGTIPAPGGISEPISSAVTDGNNLLADIQNLIVKKRSIREKRSANTSIKVTSVKIPAKRPVFGIDADLQYRVMRQVANSDPMGCLPQALCGISSIPPSSQSGFLNDYAYLLKTVLTRDEDPDDLDKDEDDADIDKFDDLKYGDSNKKKKQQVTKSDTKTGTKTSSQSTTAKKKKKVTPQPKKKKPQNANNDDESLEEDVPLDEQDLDKLRMKEAYEIENLANEELLEEEPDFLAYAMRDTQKMKLGPYSGPPGRPKDMQAPDERQQDDEYADVSPSDLNNMSEAQLDAMLAGIDGPPGRRPPGPPGGPMGHRYPPPPKSSGSFLSKLMPKVSMGLSPSKGGHFEEDPFFSGFKRSLNSGDFTEAKVRQATKEEQKMFKEIIVRRRQRMDFILRKKKELSEIKDPVEKFRIAAEFGQRVKSPRQCRILFNNCPFNYTQMLEMISGLRKAVMGQPLTPEPEKPREKDTVVVLTPAVPPPPPQQTGTKNIINLNTGNGGGMGGMTSIQHELPNGEMVEINLQMSSSGKSASKRRVTRPKITPSPTASPKLPTMSKIKKRKPADVQDLFDEDNSNNEPVVATESKPKKQPSLGSLESLKATMLAIQKINNVTIERKKQGKPVNYSNVLADLNLEAPGKIKNVNILNPRPVTRRPPTRRIKKPRPQINYQKPKRTSSLNSALSQLSSSTLGHADDDEVDEQLPTRKPASVRIKRPPFPPQNTQVSFKPTPENTKSVGSRPNVKGQKEKGEEGDDEETEDEEPSDEEDEEDEDYIESPADDGQEFRSGVITADDPAETVLLKASGKETQSTTETIAAAQTFSKRRSPSRSRQSERRKPKKLYPNASTEFRRISPL